MAAGGGEPGSAELHSLTVAQLGPLAATNAQSGPRALRKDAAETENGSRNPPPPPPRPPPSLPPFSPVASKPVS